MTVVPLFLCRRADGTHESRFLPPVELPGDITEATARLTALIEDQIRQVPEQWVWMHRRWRRQPPAAGPA
jgi:KDO2-lipid IV(A) lauroyltransferase